MGRRADGVRGLLRRHPLAAFFALAYGISWVLWAPLWLPAFGVEGAPVVPRFHHALGAYGPLGAAFVIAAAQDRAEAGRLARALVAWRGRLPWVALAVVGPALILACAVVVAAGIDGHTLSWEGALVSREFPEFSALAFFGYNVLTFGVGEEAGWRGFALPWLQARRSALRATAWLTVGWAGWHAPLFLYRPGYAAMGPADIAGWALSLFTGAVILTWLFNGSRQSILVVALFHAAIDVVFTSDLASQTAVTVSGALVTVWGLAILAVWVARARWRPRDRG